MNQHAAPFLSDQVILVHALAPSSIFNIFLSQNMLD